MADGDLTAHKSSRCQWFESGKPGLPNKMSVGHESTAVLKEKCIRTENLKRIPARRL